MKVIPRPRFAFSTFVASSKSSGRMPAITRRPSGWRPSRSRTSCGTVTSDHRQTDRSVGERRRHEVHARGADEPGHEQVRRVVVQLHRRADLLKHAAEHDRHAIAERHRLGLVVGDVDGGRVEPALDPGDLGAHLHAQLGVQVGEGLVHQERLRVTDDRAPHRDALALPAGQVRGLAREVLGQVEDVRRLLHLAVDLGLRHLGEPRARRPCSRARSCADTGRSSGTPSRCPDPAAPPG